MFINQKPSRTFCTAFNQVNCSFDKSANDQGKRLHLTHRSQCTDFLWTEFLERYFCQTWSVFNLCKCLYMVCKHFCNYCVAKSISQSNPEQVSYECLCKINIESIALWTILVTMISIKKQIPLHIRGVKGSHFSTCAIPPQKKEDGIWGQAEVARLNWRWKDQCAAVQE